MSVYDNFTSCSVEGIETGTELPFLELGWGKLAFSHSWLGLRERGPQPAWTRWVRCEVCFSAAAAGGMISSAAEESHFLKEDMMGGAHV